MGVVHQAVPAAAAGMKSTEEQLWDFILTQAWIAAVAYVAILLLAASRDILRRRFSSSFKRTFTSAPSPYRFFYSLYQKKPFFFFIEISSVINNINVCILYVYTTYRRNVPLRAVITNRIFAGVFSFDLLVGAAIAPSSLLYLLQFSRFLQVASLPSLFSASGPYAYLHFGFLRAFAAYDSYVRIERRIVQLPFAPKKFAFRLFFQCLTLFYVLAAGIQMLEIPGDWLSASFLASWEGNDWTFFNSIYWVIVTLSTVGYGDMSPATIQGRVYTLFMIIIGIIVFSNIVQDLFKEMRRSRGNGNYRGSANTRHVIVSGTPSLADLVHFVKEFYNRLSNKNARIVVLVEEPKWTDGDWYKYVARNHFLQYNVIYLLGSVMTASDLQRAGINSADAVFILTSPASSGEVSEQDTQIVMSTLAIRNSRTDIPIFSQTLLESSNVQINVAMKTPANYNFNRALIFRNELSPNAQYVGIYETIRRIEAEYLPECFLKKASVDRKHIQRPPSGSKTSYQRDLDRSSNVCSQQMYASLLVANIKANGVGTLLTNLYLELPVTHPKQPWLAEYHLGAVCSLLWAIIPESLSGASVKDIATLLFRRGIVILGTQAKGDLTIQTVLSPTRELHAGELGLFMTFLSLEHLATSLHLVGVEYERKEDFVICANFKQQRQKKKEFIPSNRTTRRPTNRASLDSSAVQQNGTNGNNGTNGANGPFSPPASRRASLPPPMNLGDASISTGNVMRPSPLSSGRSRMRGRPPIPRSVTLGDNRGLVNSRSLEHIASLARSASIDPYASADTLDMAFFDNMSQYISAGGLRKNRSSLEIPDDLCRHVIVAMEGKTPIANLPFFLRLLWHKSRKSQETRPQIAVVVIHPNLPSEVVAEFEQNDFYSRLYFVVGSPTDAKTWEKAQLSSARAVATMVDYTLEWRVSDAKTIYTLLTLDALTYDDQNLFVCSELVDEKSLEFLREPTHPRRRGARLGMPLFKHLVSEPMPTQVSRAGSGATDMADMEGSQLAESEHEHDTDAPDDVGVQPEAPPIERWASSMSESTYSDVSVPDEEILGTNAMFNPKAGSETERAELSRPNREYLFSRIRYTSGELLVHSTADTLLVREYAEPGFVKFIKSLVGANPDSPGQKIRLVRIPKSVFKDYHEVDGNRYVEYGIIFERLIELGVTPMGLYRSGAAPIRIPKMKRALRGENALQEAIVLNGNTGAQKNGCANALWGFVRDGQQVLPGNVRSQIDEDQLLGNNESEDLENKTRSTPSGGEINEYRQDSERRNVLPYVYTLPDANTLVAETDGVYILCNVSFELPRVWPRPKKESTGNDINNNNSSNETTDSISSPTEEQISKAASAPSMPSMHTTPAEV